MESLQWACSAAFFSVPLPVKSKETSETLGCSGRSSETGAFDVLAYQKCHITTGLLFHIECERFTKRLISSLVQCRSWKALLFRGTPKKSGARGKADTKVDQDNTVRSPLDNHIRVFLSPVRPSSDWWVFAEGNRIDVCRSFYSKIGPLYSRTGFSNYFSFFWPYSRVESAHVFKKVVFMFLFVLISRTVFRWQKHQIERGSIWYLWLSEEPVLNHIIVDPMAGKHIFTQNMVNSVSLNNPGFLSS